MTGDPARPPRAEDLLRHLADLRTGTYEGAGPRAERLRLFHSGAELADPVVRRVLAEADEAFLADTGTIGFDLGPDGDGGERARWELSWPRQREATGRDGSPVPPVTVVALFRDGFVHPHLRGSAAGDWPFQVRTAADAERQEPIVRAIVEAELHQRIFDGGWRIIPAG